MSDTCSSPDGEHKQCLYCNKEIHWCSIGKRWYHIVGYTSFCVGMARDLSGKNSTEAVPKG